MESLSLHKLDLVPTIDPRINVNKLENLKYNIETTGTDSVYQKFVVNNFSANSYTAVCNPPNRGVYVNKRFYQQVQYTIDFVGTSTSVPPLVLQAHGLSVPPPPAPVVNPGQFFFDAPRANPIANSQNNISVSLNGDPSSTNLNQYARALTRYHNEAIKCQDKYGSYTPSMLDQSLNYFDYPTGPRYALAGYESNFDVCPRGGFIDAVVTANTATSAQVVLTAMEPCYISPCDTSCEDKSPGFIGIDTITVIAQFGGRGNSSTLGGLASAIWSHSIGSGLVPNPSSITSAVARVTGATLYFQYTTPALTQEIPRSLVYPYTLPIYYATVSNTPMLAGSKGNMISLNNVQLNSIPSMVYLWVTIQDLGVTINSTDTYCEIENVAIVFNNKPGILSSASEYDLFNIALRHGTNLDWRQWRKDCGSVLALRFGEDIPLNNLLAAGSRGSFQFSAQLTVTNNYGFDITPQVSALFVHTGIFSIDDGVCMRQVGVLTNEDVLRTNNKVSVHNAVDQPRAHEALGGAIRWPDVLSFFKKFGRAAINIAKVAVPALAPQYKPVVDAADLLAQKAGFGRMKGGKKLTRKQMLEMMR